MNFIVNGKFSQFVGRWPFTVKCPMASHTHSFLYCVHNVSLVNLFVTKGSELIGEKYQRKAKNLKSKGKQ